MEVQSTKGMKVWLERIGWDDNSNLVYREQIHDPLRVATRALPSDFKIISTRFRSQLRLQMFWSYMSSHHMEGALSLIEYALVFLTPCCTSSTSNGASMTSYSSSNWVFSCLDFPDTFSPFSGLKSTIREDLTAKTVSSSRYVWSISVEDLDCEACVLVMGDQMMNMCWSHRMAIEEVK